MELGIITSIVYELLSDFEKHGIRYAVLRNYENNSFEDNKDLDLFIDAKQERQIIRIIEDVVKKHAFFFAKQADTKRTVVSFLYKNAQHEDSVFIIDLNRYITIKRSSAENALPLSGRRITIDEVQIIKTNNALNQQISILQPETEIFFLLNHYRNKKKESYWAKIKGFIEGKYNEKLTDTPDTATIDRLLALTAKGSDIKSKPAVVNFLNTIGILFKTLFSKLFAYRLSRVVYFSGPDGAGKSSSFIWTRAWLDKLKIRNYPLRSLQISTLYVMNVRRSLKGNNTSKGKGVLNNVGKLGYSDLKRDRDTGSKMWAFRRRIGLLIGLFDICILGRMFLFFKRLSGKVILVEESPVDIFVKRHRPQIKTLEAIFIPILPKPSLSVLCVADSKAIFARKPELDVNEIDEYYLRIKPLYNRRRAFNMKELRTDVTLEATQQTLSAELSKL